MIVLRSEFGKIINEEKHYPLMDLKDRLWWNLFLTIDFGRYIPIEFNDKIQWKRIMSLRDIKQRKIMIFLDLMLLSILMYWEKTTKANMVMVN